MPLGTVAPSLSLRSSFVSTALSQRMAIKFGIALFQRAAPKELFPSAERYVWMLVAGPNLDRPDVHIWELRDWMPSATDPNVFFRAPWFRVYQQGRLHADRGLLGVALLAENLQLDMEDVIDYVNGYAVDEPPGWDERADLHWGTREWSLNIIRDMADGYLFMEFSIDEIERRILETGDFWDAALVRDPEFVQTCTLGLIDRRAD